VIAVLGADFLNPGRLWLLLGVAALVAAYVAIQFVRQKHVVAFTNVDLLDQLAPSRPGWRRHVVAVFYMLSAVFGVIAVARPIHKSFTATETDGKILLVFDVSLSMEATDVKPNRLDAAKKAATDFIEQVDPNIEIGLISFNQNVNVRVSPTLNRKSVSDAIDKLQLGEGTSIGDALQTAAEVLGPPDPDKPDEPSGAIVLLSDGETTTGLLSTAEGAQVVAKSKIPAYAIAFGTASGTVIDGNTGDVVPVPVNNEELKGVADTTGAKFYKAPTADALEGAYDEISKNLNNDVGDPIETTTENTWKYAFAALGLLAAGWLLGLVLLRGLL
jgi:Ca-activated chloride channel family protein